MKKSILLLMTVVLSVNLFAQGFDLSKLRAGAGLSYFTASNYSSIGIGLNGVYSFTDEWEGAVGFSHFFEKDYLVANVLDFDGHYVFFDNGAGMNVYGVAGVGITFMKVNVPDGYEIIEGSTTTSNFGFNLGIGMNYALSDVLNLMPEVRYTIIDGSYARIGATLQYKF